MNKLVVDCSNDEIQEIPLTQEEMNLKNAPKPVEDLLREIRVQRNILLSNSDRYMLEDYPITAEKKLEWKTYRQALRDFPETCDPYNPVWPTTPL